MEEQQIHQKANAENFIHQVGKIFAEFPTSGTFFEIICDPKSTLAVATFGAGLLFCFFGRKFKTICLSIAFCTIVYDFIGKLITNAVKIKEGVEFIGSNFLKIFNSVVGKNLQSTFQNFLNQKSNLSVGIFILSVIITAISIYFKNFKSLGVIIVFYKLQEELQKIFVNEAQTIPGVHYVVSIALIMAAYCLFESASIYILSICLSFIGGLIILIAISTFTECPKGFSNFAKELAQPTFSIIKNPNFYYWVLISSYGFILQNLLK